MTFTVLRERWPFADVAWAGASRSPPVGREASQDSRSSGRYRTSDPTLMNCGPRRSSLQRLTDARLTCSRLVTSSSVNRVFMFPTFLFPAEAMERTAGTLSLHLGAQVTFFKASFLEGGHPANF